MAAYLKRAASPHTRLQSLNRLGPQPFPGCVALTVQSVASPGRSFINQARRTGRATTGQLVDESAMSQYLRMILSMYNRCTGSSSATTVPGTQQRSYATSASPSSSPPTLVSSSPRHEGARISERSLGNGNRKQQSNSFSSTSSSSSSSFQETPNSNSRSKQGPQLDFSRLSNLIAEQSPNGTSSLWYVVVTAALLGFHHEPGVGELWKYISSLGGGQSQQIAIARRIRESCLKASVLVGFPRGINGLLSLQSSLETHSSDLLPTLNSDTSLRASISPQEKYDRGKDFFSHIYTRHTDRVLESMGRSSGGDLSYYAVASIYGELMAETSIVSGKETGVLEFVCCLVDDVAPQAKGHFFGCKNLGASGAEIRGTISLVREVARQLGLDRIPGDSEDFRFLSKAEGW